MIQPMVDINTADYRQSRGKRIADAIDASGKTQREVADLVGVTPQSITKWIRTGNIYIDNLQTLADIIGVDASYLIDGRTVSQVADGAGRYSVSDEPKHSSLHALVDRFSDDAAKKLILCAQAIYDAEGRDAEVTIEIDGKKI